MICVKDKKRKYKNKDPRTFSDSKTGNALKGGAAVAMVTLSSLSLYKAVAATATLPIIARIVRAIEITINTSIDFGTLALTEDVAATAVLDTSSNTLKIDGQGGVNIAGGFPTAGRIRIRGAAVPVQVSLETNNLQLTNGTTYLTINNFNLNTANGGANITVTPAGQFNSVVLSVGATLKARPKQLTGTYIGNNTIFANYQ